MKLKKIICFIWAVLMMAGFAPLNNIQAGEKLLCSTYPVYLFTRAITEGRSHYEVELMLDSALGCPHDYAPTPAELNRLSQAGVLVINGMGLEAFLGRALSVASEELKVIDASSGVVNKTRRLEARVLSRKEALDEAEGVLADHGHDHDHDADPNHEHAGAAFNAHLFASPSTAANMVKAIAAGLGAIDPDGSELYSANAAALRRGLDDLSVRMRAVGNSLDNPKVIISHSIFEYLARDLNFTVAASIEEEDGAEPSAARLAELIKLARREEVRAIIIDPQSNQALARTLGEEAKVPVVVIDPVASGPAEASRDYYQKTMKAHLDFLRKTLGGSTEKK